jgi:threonine dehydratase
MTSLADVLAARRNIGPHVYRTTLRRSFSLSERCGGDIYLKTENLQRTGSFKVRGALNKVLGLTNEEKAKGTVAASSGNFAVGAAYATHTAGGIPLHLFMAEPTPRSKLDKLREYHNVQITLTGQDYEDAHEASARYQQQTGQVYLHTFDDPMVIAGQGTVGLEILEDLPDVDVIVVPIGGGGLISGIAVAAKAIKPTVQVVGVQVSASPSAYLSLKEGRCYEHYKSAPTTAEGLAGGFGLLPFDMAKHLIDDVILIDEDEIVTGIYTLLEKEQLVVEASGVVGVSALLSGKLQSTGKKVAVVLSGGNIDTRLLRRIVREAGDEEE